MLEQENTAEQIAALDMARRGIYDSRKGLGDFARLPAQDKEKIEEKVVSMMGLKTGKIKIETTEEGSALFNDAGREKTKQSLYISLEELREQSGGRYDFTACFNLIETTLDRGIVSDSITETTVVELDKIKMLQNLFEYFKLTGMEQLGLKGDPPDISCADCVSLRGHAGAICLKREDGKIELYLLRSSVLTKLTRNDESKHKRSKPMRDGQKRALFSDGTEEYLAVISGYFNPGDHIMIRDLDHYRGTIKVEESAPGEGDGYIKEDWEGLKGADVMNITRI